MILTTFAMMLLFTGVGSCGSSELAICAPPNPIANTCDTLDRLLDQTRNKAVWRERAEEWRDRACEVQAACFAAIRTLDPFNSALYDICYDFSPTDCQGRMIDLYKERK